MSCVIISKLEAFNRSRKLKYLQQQVNTQCDKISNSQFEICQIKSILADARRRLEIMKNNI